MSTFFTARRAAAMAALLLAGASLTACAGAADPAGMALGANSNVAAINTGHPAYQAVTVTTVTGGSKTNPLWVSKVSSEDFKTALEASLKAKGYLAANGSGKIKVTAELVGLKQPMAGLDMSVTTQVRYTATDLGGKVLFNQLVAATGTAKLGESLIGVQRLRLANEHAVEANIESFITQLDAAVSAK